MTNLELQDYYACKVKRSSNTIGVQLQVIQYLFQIKTLSRETPSFQRRNWLKNKRGSEVEIRCSMSITKYAKCEGDRLWSMKWMRSKWMTKWMRWNLVYDMNEMKLTKQICNMYSCFCTNISNYRDVGEELCVRVWGGGRGCKGV